MPDTTVRDVPSPPWSSGYAGVSTRLVFVAHADDPAATSTSHALDQIDEVRFGRGDRGVERTCANGRRILVVRLPDARVSRAHGTLTRCAEGWVLDDPESTNAAVVDGEVVRRGVIGDGAVLEFGRSFFVLRTTSIDRELPQHLAGDARADQLPSAALGMATFSPSLAREFEAIALLASRPVSVLLLGQSGTGKEVAARMLHALSGRSGPFVAVNCGALSAGLIEAELFGHGRGAFTGAVGARRGLIRSADRGTLFLDEIGELPAAAQATLLRVIQEREVHPVGEDRPVRVDLRVVSATLRDLASTVDQGTFRTDLYARLTGHVVTLPPLCERREDLGLLIAALLPRITDRGLKFAPHALGALLRYDWPQNVRELEQVLTTAAAFATDGVIEIQHLPPALRNRASKPAAVPAALARLSTADRELRDKLVALFTSHHGNVYAVAEALGKPRAQIYKWIRKLAIELSEYRRAR